MAWRRVERRRFFLQYQPFAGPAGRPHYYRPYSVAPARAGCFGRPPKDPGVKLSFARSVFNAIFCRPARCVSCFFCGVPDIYQQRKADKKDRLADNNFRGSNGVFRYFAKAREPRSDLRASRNAAGDPIRPLCQPAPFRRIHANDGRRHTRFTLWKIDQPGQEAAADNRAGFDGRRRSIHRFARWLTGLRCRDRGCRSAEFIFR